MDNPFLRVYVLSPSLRSGIIQKTKKKMKRTVMILRTLRRRRQLRNCMKSMQNLPTDALINILGFVGDRDFWNYFITMNKGLHQAYKSPTVTLPWPSNRALKLGDRSYYSRGKEQFAMSADSQWLLWVTYTDAKQDMQTRLKVRLWNRKTGPLPTHEISVEKARFTCRGSKFNAAKISKDLRYIAVYDRCEVAPIIRVYDLTVDGKMTGFDPSNYFDLVCPDERVRYQDVLSDKRFNDTEDFAFDFTPNSKKLCVQYSFGSNKWTLGRNKYLTAVWDIEAGGKWITSKAIGTCCRLFGDADAISDDLVLWTDQLTSMRFPGYPNTHAQPTDSILRAWSFDSPEEVPTSSTDVTPRCFNDARNLVARMRIAGSAVNPTNQAVIAVVMEPFIVTRGETDRAASLCVALLRVERSGRQMQTTTCDFKSVLKGSHMQRRFDPVRASIAWFPDGQHIAFISSTLGQIMLYKVKQNGYLGEPSASSIPSKLVAKANAFAVQEQKKSAVKHGRCLFSSKYISRFDLSTDGEVLTLVLTTVFSTRSEPLDEQEVLEAAYMVSM